MGRDAELEHLKRLLAGDAQSPRLAILTGEGGVGKSRLAEEFLSHARARGWNVAWGRAYPVESGVPYAPFSDALLPVLQAMAPDTLTVLSRGGETELRYLFPALKLDGDVSTVDASVGADPEEFQTRILWNFAEFLKSFAARTPFLLVLEDLQWADESSLSLLHFIARQAPGPDFFVLCTYNDSEPDQSPHILQLKRSLFSLHLGEVVGLEPLTRDQVLRLLVETFEEEEEVVSEFAALLYGWTRGNPFFLEEILKSLVANGTLESRDGTWIGWNAQDVGLPGSVRDAVLARLAGFSDAARRVADLAAVIGTRAEYPLLESISSLAEDALLAALEELCSHRVLTEHAEGDTVVYDFTHPLVRETLYGKFGLQRARLLHGEVAEAMEEYWGDEALEHADELAFHFARTAAANLGAKAVRYLSAAGRSALDRHAPREALAYLDAAQARVDRSEGEISDQMRREVLNHLARAHRRVGEYREAAEIWTAMLEDPDAEVDRPGLHRAVGFLHLWQGQHDDALRHLEEGLAEAVEADERASVVRLRLARSHFFLQMGRGVDARKEAETALPLAEALEDTDLMARVHRSLALLHVWIGPPDKARENAGRAIDLAQAAGDVSAEFWARWGLAVLGGMTGDASRMEEGIREATELAERIRSPVLRLWTAEMSIELAFATGDWDTAVALGEQSIGLARSLNQRALLPRLLVWTSLVYVGRGDLDRAKALVDEAGDIAGIHEEEGPLDVHLVVPVYTGLAHYLVGVGDYHDAIEAARKGLRIAEGTGYIVWMVHRLLPILAEACLWAGEIDEAAEVGRTLRGHAEALDHKLGLAWADACDALVQWKRGDPEGGAVRMRQAAEALEKIPMIPYAARIRRQLAGRLADIGDTEGALEELRRVHDIFAKLGADLELEKARIQFREIGQRPPPRGMGEGMAGLTPRELEIARLVARRKSNKGVGKELGISPRTVSTHLSNVYQKLDISSRGELADLIREKGLLAE